MAFGRRIENRVSQAMSRVEHTASEADKAIVETNARVAGLVEEVKDGFTLVPVFSGKALWNLVRAIAGILIGIKPKGDLEFPVKIRVELEENSPAA